MPCSHYGAVPAQPLVMLWNAAGRDIPVAMSGYDIWLRNLVATFQLRHSGRGIRLQRSGCRIRSRNLVMEFGCGIWLQHSRLRIPNALGSFLVSYSNV